jgi:2-polyprenyl-6-methoxyphenol hydroxylase-like FAD-dependent oxidoreductase
MQAHHDVVVVGSRVAGAATALLLARLGHDVVVVDRTHLPSDTISTHQIARTGVVALHRWGLLDDVIASGAPAIRQVTFHTGDERVTRTIKLKSGVDCLVAPRRYMLDTLLTDAARRAGATIRHGVSVHAVTRDVRGRATGVRGEDRRGDPVEIQARFVVGADGLGSAVAKSVGAPRTVDRGAMGASQYAYYTGLSWPAIEFITRERSFAGVFPTHDGEAAIWVCTPSSAALAARRAGPVDEMFDAQLRQAAPELAQRLAGARRTSPVRGMLRAPNQIRRGIGPGWVLVGDAAAHRDPVTGHGISDAFRDAELAAVAIDAVLSGAAAEPVALQRYESARLAEMAEIFDLTCAIAAYPPLPEFTEHNKLLGTAIDAEAATLAARPAPAAASAGA